MRLPGTMSILTVALGAALVQAEETRPNPAENELPRGRAIGVSI